MKVMNKSGGQLNLRGMGEYPVIVLADKGEHSFKDEKELAAYKPNILKWGTMLELSAEKASAPAKEEKKAEKPAEPKKEEKAPEAPKKEDKKEAAKPALEGESVKDKK